MCTQVLDAGGKNYRLLKDNLDKDIIPEASKYIVKKVTPYSQFTHVKVLLLVVTLL